MTELYFSTDVESDGPIPGPHSMLSFARAAYDSHGRLIETFARNLQLLEGAMAHPDTAKFWAENRDAYSVTRIDTVAPAVAMSDYAHWIETTARNARAKPVFVAYPAGYDFLFVYWYLIRFTGRSPFSHSALDMKTYAAAVLGLPYRDITKRVLATHWPSSRRHSHVALDDAIEQGEMFCQMLRSKRPDEDA